jgi:hypothetical protein
MGEFIWTQSALKDFENTITCPRRWYERWITRSIKSETKEVMNYGHYGEYLIIGANAKGRAVTDLTRTKGGEKTAAQKRIEAQAERARPLLFDPEHPDYLGIIPKDYQVHLSGTVAGIPVEGTADVTGEDGDTVPVLIDIKFTDDAFSTAWPEAWGHPVESQDLIQLVLYANLYMQQYGKRPRAIILIVEYGTKERIRVIEVDITDPRVKDMVNRFTSASEVKKLYDQHGYVEVPDPEECEDCKLQCESRKVKTTVFKEIHTY